MGGACLLPVKEERVEVVASEVHHREEHVLIVFLKPQLGVLPHGVVAVPPSCAIAACIVVFAYRRTAELDPWLDGLDGIVDTAHYACDIVAPPVAEGHAARLAVEIGIREVVDGLGIPYVVEGYAVNVVAFCYLPAYRGYIVSCLGLAWYHEHLSSFGGFDKLAFLLDDG